MRGSEVKIVSVCTCHSQPQFYIDQIKLEVFNHILEIYSKTPLTIILKECNRLHFRDVNNKTYPNYSIKCCQNIQVMNKSLK